MFQRQPFESTQGAALDVELRENLEEGFEYLETRRQIVVLEIPLESIMVLPTTMHIYLLVHLEFYASSLDPQRIECQAHRRCRCLMTVPFC